MLRICSVWLGIAAACLLMGRLAGQDFALSTAGAVTLPTPFQPIAQPAQIPAQVAEAQARGRTPIDAERAALDLAAERQALEVREAGRAPDVGQGRWIDAPQPLELVAAGRLERSCC